MTNFKLAPQLANDTIELGKLTLCKVLLMNDSQFPWIILVPQRANIIELYQLEADDIKQVQAESLMISKLLMQHFNGDKLNTGALGNMVPQLHLHHIVRFKKDPVWPKPVWGNISAIAYSTNEAKTLTNELQALIKTQTNAFTATDE